MSAELHVITAEPVATDIVAVLEGVLTEARAGRLSSVAIATVDRQGIVNSAWSKPPSTSAMMGAIERLKWKLMQAWEA